MSDAQSTWGIWKKLVVLGALAFILIVAGLTIYCWYLSFQIDKRFSGRRWSIPSRVYSDITILYPGQEINWAFLQGKLDHLGYRQVSETPEREGEIRILRSRLEIFLHGLKLPSHERKGFPAQISLSKNRIESISRLDTGEQIPILELEPEELMLFFGPERERRELVSIEQVPQNLVKAVLAAEDNRFYRHWGIDLRGIVRALYTNLRHASIRQGGSTITQQLSKNYFLSPERNLSRKFKEFLISLTMEVLYEKSEILEIYLNEIYLGQKGSVSINGLGEASRFYFGKPVRDLSLVESATLAGLIKGPNSYSPFVDRERCRERRDAVLESMLKNGWISAMEFRKAIAAPVKTVPVKTLARQAPYFVDYLSDQLTTLYSQEDLASLGLSIYTTLDTQVQTAAEQALASGLDRLEKSNPDLGRSDTQRNLQGAVIVMQPKTGYILAMVGGRDYAASQFNRTTQAQRQPGSAFKPFVFLSALDTFTPVSELSNEPQSYDIDGKRWQPQNYEPVLEGRLTMRAALARSVNRATVDLAMQVGMGRIIETASAFHFSTPLKPYPSLALGAAEVIPLELARAYCAFAADGLLPYPLSLKEVSDETGSVLDRRHMTVERVTSPEKAFIMTSMLRSVVTEGTARSLERMGVTFPTAGKTGTTNDFKDAWFVGYTPDILALVWVGFDHGQSVQSTGSSAALPIWADLVKAIPQHISGDWFRAPPGVVKKTVCSESGKLAVRDGCPQPREEVFLVDHVPTEICPLHSAWGPFRQIIKGIRDLFKDS